MGAIALATTAGTRPPGIDPGAHGAIAVLNDSGELLEGDDQRLRPLEERREALMWLVDGVGGILFSEALAAEGAVVFAKACELGLEASCPTGRAASIGAGSAAGWLRYLSTPAKPFDCFGCMAGTTHTMARLPKAPSLSINDRCKAGRQI